MKKLLLTSLSFASLAFALNASAKPNVPGSIVTASGTPCTAAELAGGFETAKMGDGCGLCHNTEGAMLRMGWLDNSAWEVGPEPGKAVPDLTAAIWTEIAAVDFDQDGVSDADEITAGWNPRLAYDDTDATKLCAGALAWPGAPDPAAGGAGGMGGAPAGGAAAAGMGGMAAAGMGGMAAAGMGGMAAAGMGGMAAAGMGGMAAAAGMGGMAAAGMGGMAAAAGMGGMAAAGMGGAAAAGAPAGGAMAGGGMPASPPAGMEPPATAGAAATPPGSTAGGGATAAPMEMSTDTGGDDGGCSVAPSNAGGSYAWLGLLGLGLLRRRRNA